MYSYAEYIFSLGTELLQNLKNKEASHQLHFTIGVTDIIPKVLAFDLFKTCLDYDESLKLICNEGDLESLLADLAANKLDIIFSDQPLPPGGVSKHITTMGKKVRHSCQSGIGGKVTSDFPKCLHNFPFFYPEEKSTQRVELMPGLIVWVLPDVVGLKTAP